MAATLVISPTPHSVMPTAAIDALTDIARRHKIDVAEKPVVISTRDDASALVITADAVDESAFEKLMQAMWQWCDQTRPSGAVDLTLRIGALDLLVEQTSPVRGSKAISALLADIVESIRLLRQSGLLRYVSRLLVTPGQPHGEVRADIGSRPAYLIAPAHGALWKAPGAGNVPWMG